MMPPKEVDDAPCEVDLRVQIVSRPPDHFRVQTGVSRTLSGVAGAQPFTISGGTHRVGQNGINGDDMTDRPLARGLLGLRENGAFLGRQSLKQVGGVVRSG